MSATIALGLSMFATAVFEKPLAVDLSIVRSRLVEKLRSLGGVGVTETGEGFVVHVNAQGVLATVTINVGREGVKSLEINVGVFIKKEAETGSVANVLSEVLKRVGEAISTLVEGSAKVVTGT
jgi:hypothetical protein